MSCATEPRWLKRPVFKFSADEAVGWNCIKFGGFRWPKHFFFLPAWELTFHQHSSRLLVLIGCAAGACVRILFITRWRAHGDISYCYFEILFKSVDLKLLMGLERPNSTM